MRHRCLGVLNFSHRAMQSFERLRFLLVAEFRFFDRVLQMFDRLIERFFIDWVRSSVLTSNCKRESCGIIEPTGITVHQFTHQRE